MYAGKTLFAQIMDLLPWTTFHRVVLRYDGNHRTKTLSCAEQFRVMAFARLTYRESLRDIEVCLLAQAAKLYHMGFREPIKRSTLADANEARDWHIYADFAQVLIRQARALYAQDRFSVDLSNAVYALDSTTIDLCLSMFPWALFRSTKAAVTMHTLLDLWGAIPSFIHISDGKLHDVNILDLLAPEAGAFYVMDRGYLDVERLSTLHQAHAFFSDPSQVQPRRAASVLGAGRSHDRDPLRPDHRLQWLPEPPALSGTPAPHPLQGNQHRQDAGLLDQPRHAPGADDLHDLQEPVAGRTVLQVDPAASADQAVLRHVRECGDVANLDRRVGLGPRRHHQKAPQTSGFALHIATDSFGHPVRENARSAGFPGQRRHIGDCHEL